MNGSTTARSSWSFHRSRRTIFHWPRKLSGGALELKSISIGGGLSIGLFPLLVFATAVIVIFVIGLGWWGQKDGLDPKELRDRT